MLLAILHLSPAELARVKSLVDRISVPQAAERLGVSKQSLYAMLAEQNVRDGTVALVRRALELKEDK